jgi:hypothetical protein
VNVCLSDPRYVLLLSSRGETLATLLLATRSSIRLVSLARLSVNLLLLALASGAGS